MERALQALTAPALDALDAHAAVLDAAGVIVHVNDAWRRFGLENGARPGRADVGTSYLDACETALRRGDATAAPILAGLRSVLAGDSPRFEAEYPCDSPDAPRWFSMRVVPVAGEPRLFLVLHENVTARKLAADVLATQSVARMFVQRMLREIGKGDLASHERRRLGKALAAETGIDRLAGFLDAYHAMGLGELSLERAAGERYVFRATGLVESVHGSRQPTCHITLGYLEGAVESSTGMLALGEETGCQSQGLPRCTFTVQARRRP